MSSNLSPDQQWSNLNPAQREGEACVWCNRSYIADGAVAACEVHPIVPSAPVGYSDRGQVFACTGECVGHLEAFALTAEHLGETAPIDVVAARQRLDDPLITSLAKGSAVVDQARTAIDEAEAEGIDVTHYRAELAKIAEKLADLAVEVEATS